MPRTALITAAALASLSVGCDGFHGTPEPADWLPPTTSVGDGVLAKELVASVRGLGGIDDVALGRLEGESQVHLIVACAEGFVLLDPATGAERRRVKFEIPPELGEPLSLGRPQILDVDGDGALEFVLLGESWIGKTSVHGADGRARWIHPAGEDLAPNLTVCGDLDGDGTLEFLMAYNATPEVELLDARGQLLWRQAWSQLHSDNVQLLDTDGDGVLEIAYADGQALWVRDRNGALRSRVVPPGGGYVNALELLESWGDPPDQALLVGSYVKAGKAAGQNFYLFSADGGRCLGTATGQDLSASVHTRPVRLAGAEQDVLVRADQVRLQAWPAGYAASRLRLRVFAADRELVFEEILKDPEQELVSGGGVFLLPRGSGDSSFRMLVAFGSNLWEYSLAE